MRGWTLVEGLGRDVRYGLRSIRRTPAFTAVAVLALAIGIGANSTIFSVVNTVLLRPLPYQDPERLVVILHHGTDPVSAANLNDWRAQGTAFETMGAAELWSPNLTGADRPQKLAGLRVTPEIFPLLGVPPLLGRVFLPEEGEVGREREVVLSHALWQRDFGADKGIIGRTALLDGDPYTVVGVMPAGFRFAPFWATRSELWAPLPLRPRLSVRGGNSLRAFARLKAGATLERARAEITAIAARLEREFPGTNRDVQVVPLSERVVGDVRPALVVLLVAVGLVLLIACANVAHLFLARAAARDREIAVRTALGASRGQLVAQLLTEGLLVALAGGVAGLALAGLGVRAVHALGPVDLPRIETLSLDGRVLGFTLLVTLLAGLGFGLAPAVQGSTVALSETLKDGVRGSSTGGRRSRFRSGLIVSEFALALMLLVGAGLMLRSFAALRGIDPGLESGPVLTMVVSVSGAEAGAAGRRASFYRELLDRVRALPGVEAASGINHLPIAGDIWGWPFQVEGRPAPRPGEEPTATYRVVYPGYFATMGIPIRAGRDIAPTDGPGVVVINQAMARRHWPGGDPLGKQIRLRVPLRDSIPYTVIGVVGNVVQADWTAPRREEMYLPFAQSRAHLEARGPAFAYLTLVLRTKGDPARLGPEVARVVAALDRDVPVSEVQTMDAVVAAANAEPRFYVVLLGGFAGAALLLAAVGIYGVMSYLVSRRTREIGIRLTLGATRGDVVRLVVGQGMRVAGLGGLIGVVGALALTRLMSRVLYGVGPADPITFAAVALLLAMAAFAATFLPARRASRIDPIAAVRME